MNGSIFVRSHLGKGSRFTVQLPLSELSWPVSSEIDTLATIDKPKQQLDIVVCDDDDDIRSLLSICLVSAGHRAHPISNGREALEFLQHNRMDAMILDMQMPGMSGFDVIKEVRRTWGKAELPVVAVSASAMKSEKSRILSLGCNGLVTKPVSVKTFASQIERYISAQGIYEDGQ